MLSEERNNLLRDFTRSFDAIYDTLPNVRRSTGWEARLQQVRRLMSNPQRPLPAAAVA